MTGPDKLDPIAIFAGALFVGTMGLTAVGFVIWAFSVNALVASWAVLIACVLLFLVASRVRSRLRPRHSSYRMGVVSSTGLMVGDALMVGGEIMYVTRILDEHEVEVARKREP